MRSASMPRPATTDTIVCYQASIAVPLGDLIARRALEQPVPDLRAAYDGILCKAATMPQTSPA